MQNKFFIFFFTVFLSFVCILNARETTNVLKIQADKIDYSQNDEVLNATGNVKINHENGIEVKTSKVTYNKKDGLVKIDSQFELIDKNKRSIIGEQLLYNINEQLITAEKKNYF
jgi:lipopolysaccharide assembly outer membrane protein LptD (OstA)